MITRKHAIIQLTALLGSTSFFRLCSNVSTGINKEIRSYQDLICAIAETIIPETSTPGANEADVYLYIVNVTEMCLSDRDKRIILSGLDDVEEYSLKKYSLSFTECPENNKNKILKYFYQKGVINNTFLNKVKNKVLGPSFFELFKKLTVQGYCCSKVGATQGLAYDHIPVNYIACTPLSSNQRSWATS